MKRLLSGILALALCLGFSACAEEKPAAQQSEPAVTDSAQLTEKLVPEPMEMPSYEFDHTPTTDELRQMAVKAMRDSLTVQFAVDKFYRYTKREMVGEKFYTYIPQNVYCGLPYDDAGLSLIHFYEYYDPTIGLFSFPDDPQLIDTMVGNSCAGSVTAAMATVSPSIRGFVTYEMIPHYGFIAVGPYKIPDGLASLKEIETQTIIEMNGKDVMYESYAQILPADGLTSRPDDHAIMAIEPAHVVYRADGSIDPSKSYIVIQDQRGGTGKGYYTETVDGVDYHLSGRVYAEYTFKELLDLGYIPVTAPEFVGLKEYVAPYITFDRPDCTLEDVSLGTVSSPYTIYIGRMILVDEDGNETLVDKVITRPREYKTDGEFAKFELSLFAISPQTSAFRDMLEAGKSYTLRYEVVLANGSTHTVVEIPVTG